MTTTPVPPKISNVRANKHQKRKQGPFPKTAASWATSRASLLGAPQARFEKNMQRHKGLAWADVRAKLDPNPKKLRTLDEMELSGGANRMWWVAIKRRASIFFMIVHLKAPGNAEVSVMTTQPGRQGRSENKPPDSAMNMASRNGDRTLPNGRTIPGAAATRRISTQRPRVGCKHRLRYENSGAPSLPIEGSTTSSYTTMAPNLTTRRSAGLP